MINAVDVDITIRDNETGDYVRVPVVPTEVSYSDGDAMVNTVKVLNLGSVDFRDGVELDTLSWSAFFPGRYDSGYCSFVDIRTPIEYRDLFRKWKEASTRLQIIIPAAGINKEMKLYSFPWTLKGFEGDIYYSVTFKEYKAIRPVQVPLNTTTLATTEAAAQDPANRPPVAAVQAPSSYTVQEGDTLVLIAKKLNISNWRDIYDKNKEVIGIDPNKIYPGQVYTL